MSNIFLQKNKGYSWFTDDFIHIKGCFFDKENNFYEKETLILFFKGVRTKDIFAEKIKEINGIFTVIIKYEDTIFLASDTSRIFPIFYSKKNSILYLSDDIQYLKNHLQINQFDKSAENEFLSSQYTSGKKTLLNNIYQNQSNQYLVFEKNTICDEHFFFKYTYVKDNNCKYSDLKEQAIRTIESSFKRLLFSLNNKQVIIPLSGGFDSRLIAVLLKKHNYTNVLCFTYGKKNNLELKNAKKTANTLGYKWINITHSKELIYKFVTDKTFKEYAHFSGNYCAMPFLQEYFSVKYLHENKLINPDAIFIPGHCGDFLGGSQFSYMIPRNLKKNKIIPFIFKTRFGHHKLTNNVRAKILLEIEKNLLIFDKDYLTKKPHSVFEDYDLKELFTKFIFNSANVYNFFGYEQRFPYWDLELLSFFKTMPYDYKENKKLYDDVLKNYYFKDFNVNFNNEIQPTNFTSSLQKIKNKVKLFLPYFIREKKLKKNDSLNYSIMIDELNESMKKNGIIPKPKIKNYNEHLIQWYLSFSKGLIK